MEHDWCLKLHDMGFLEYEESLSFKFETISEYTDGKKRGIIIKRDTAYYLYDNPEYTNIKKLRGNTPDIVYRYIVLLKTNLTRAIKLTQAFPEYNQQFKRAREDLFYVNNEIFKTYQRNGFNSRMLKQNPIIFCSGTTTLYLNYFEDFITRINQKYPKGAKIHQFTKEYYYSDNAFLYRITTPKIQSF